MIGVVSFDYFQPTSYFDAGFSEMPAWSSNFEWLGYDSINFVEGAGSIIIFAFGFILRIIVAPFVVKFNSCCKCKCRRVQKYFSFKNVSKGSLEFVHGTFFELLVCTSISMAMLQYAASFTASDTFSVVMQMLFALVLCVYVLTATYFTIKTSALMQISKAGKLAEKR